MISAPVVRGRCRASRTAPGVPVEELPEVQVDSRGEADFLAHGDDPLARRGSALALGHLAAIVIAHHE